MPNINCNCPKCKKDHVFFLEYKFIGNGKMRKYCTECNRVLFECDKEDESCVPSIEILFPEVESDAINNLSVWNNTSIEYAR